MNPNADPQPGAASPRPKPRFALAVATVFGVGYIPKAPGTFGSLVGILFTIITDPVALLFILPSSSGGFGMVTPSVFGHPAGPVFFLVPSIVALLIAAFLGVWSASRVAAYTGANDPQRVVIDEVSGMHLTLVLALMPLGMPTRLAQPAEASGFALYSAMSLLNWKYLLAGFILFRVFDIWKPYPVRRLEKLPGGWGIMADDWMAGVYAAILLRILILLGVV